MGRIQRTGYSEEYQSSISAEIDKNDCSIKAISIATGIPYKEVYAAAFIFGRKKNGATPISVSLATIKSLGYHVEEWTWQDVRFLIKLYPGNHGRLLRNITSHHPRRFPEVWRKVVGDKVLIMSSHTHMLCYRDGVVHDWSINRALRMVRIWTITKRSI